MNTNPDKPPKVRRIPKGRFPKSISDLYRLTCEKWNRLYQPPRYAFDPDVEGFYSISGDDYQLFPAYMQAKINRWIAGEGEYRTIRIPFGQDDVLNVHRAIKFANLRLGRGNYSERLIGVSDRMLKLYEQIDRVYKTPTETPILILGETGTGKELVARAIWSKSFGIDNDDKPFIALNCASLPDTLIEDELFGHDKFAFTDAKTMKKGIFELAKNGVAFLDEIGEIPPHIQVKLLRALNERTFTRLGGTKEKKINARIITASNRLLQKSEVRKSPSANSPIFRDDLYYRLEANKIQVPALRENITDITLLLCYYSSQVSKGKRFYLGAANLIYFLMYDWPGNVRELKNRVGDLFSQGGWSTELNQAEESFRLYFEDFNIPDNGLLDWISEHLKDPKVSCREEEIYPDQEGWREKEKERERRDELFDYTTILQADSEFYNKANGALGGLPRNERDKHLRALVNLWRNIRNSFAFMQIHSPPILCFSTPELFDEDEMKRIDGFLPLTTEKWDAFFYEWDPDNRWSSGNWINPYLTHSIHTYARLLKKYSGNDPWPELRARIRGEYNVKPQVEHPTVKRSLSDNYQQAKEDFEMKEYWPTISARYPKASITELHRITGASEKTIRKKIKK